MSTCVFIQIRCRPGTTYKVAEDITLREIHSELYSTSGDYDLLIPDHEQIYAFQRTLGDENLLVLLTI